MTKTLALISLQYASAGNNPGVPIVFLIGGLSLFFGGLTKINRARLIANMPTSKIRSVAMGLVEIYGKSVSIRIPLQRPLAEKSVYTADSQLPNGKEEENALIRSS